MSNTIRHISASEFITTQWSGGATTQIAIAPEGANYANRDFLWRISSATVELKSSDFTPLPDYERFLSTLKGEVQVQHDGGSPIMLTPGKIHRFDGAVATHSEGTCTDFNLMLRKNACKGEMRCLHLGEMGSIHLSRTLGGNDAATTFVIYCAAGNGEVSIGDESSLIEKGEAVLIENSEPTVHCKESSMFLLCEIVNE